MSIGSEELNVIKEEDFVLLREVNELPSSVVPFEYDVYSVVNESLLEMLDAGTVKASSEWQWRLDGPINLQKSFVVIVEFALLDGTIGALQRRADFVSPLMHQFIFPAGFSSPQKYWSLEELSLMISAMRHLAYVPSRFSLMFSPLFSGSPSA